MRRHHDIGVEGNDGCIIDHRLFGILAGAVSVIEPAPDGIAGEQDRLALELEPYDDADGIAPLSEGFGRSGSTCRRKVASQTA
jgi:hypothetical protein